MTAAEAAKALGIKIYTIVAGSNDPLPFPVKLSDGTTRLMNLPAGYFPIDEKLLAQIAKTGDGKYFRATDTASANKAFKEIDRLEKTKIEMEKSVDYHDYFPLALFIAFLLLGTETLP
jgi:Ca-activated chloride channel family protein